MPLLNLAAIAVILLIFVAIGSQARSIGGLDDYLTARQSQSGLTLGLSFLASGMGAWILFAPPEVGAFVGPVAVAGYALGSALPFVVLGVIGPTIRRQLPAGRSLTEFAASRFGGAMRRWVSILSVLYMLCFLAAELTAIGAITTLLSGLDGRYVIVGVALATLIYTAIGGLRASLLTDRWQAWLLVGLVGLVAFAALALAPARPGEAAPTSTLPNTGLAASLGVALTLIIAVTAANLFHQGYWQRVWAARDDRALKTAALVGGASTVGVVAVLGGAGILAGLRGLPLGSPPIPFFALLSEAPQWLALPALVLAITLVASSVDTLQNALVSLGVTESQAMGLTGARWLSALLMLPVVGLALQEISVLRLFLIADLLCATAVVPLLSGLSERVPTRAAILGAGAGLIGAVLPGTVMGGSIAAGLVAASFPAAVPTLGPFLGALVASSLITGLVSAGWPVKRPD
ncbi:solute symporter-like protein [Spiribacter salinus M19-40]|uniref:Solute symporter-like protein n=1 Tax=Spiribacter salinus M19-40 TaxID=1260251 RepID=R4V6F4_9GAMM|nr:solute symporter-like protein [Spiribacter salinus]AGM40620.1 solute symporter-like protein [Spiribacter salinus M19-40]MBY5267849.1 sodium:solute symporter [Spiribacter salinus]